MKASIKRCFHRGGVANAMPNTCVCVGPSAAWCWVRGSQRTHAGAEHMVEALLCPRGLLDLVCNLIWSLTQVSQKLSSVTEACGTVPQPNVRSRQRPNLVS